jgi:DNA-binding transcriptional regulator YiaG
MPNIATVLKEEVMRLARKELRIETEKLKKASAAFRSEIAALKRRASELEKQVAGLSKAAAKAGLTKARPVGSEGDEGTSIRFSAKGLAKQRERLGLSAQAFGMLLGVSAQTVYNWEAGKSKPRRSQLPGIAAVRSMGKRGAKKVLEGMNGAVEEMAAD